MNLPQVGSVIVIFSLVILLGFGSVDIAEAAKASGVSTTEINSAKVCGDRLCDTPMTIEEKIAEFRGESEPVPLRGFSSVDGSKLIKKLGLSLAFGQTGLIVFNELFPESDPTDKIKGAIFDLENRLTDVIKGDFRHQYIKDARDTLSAWTYDFIPKYNDKKEAGQDKGKLYSSITDNIRQTNFVKVVKANLQDEEDVELQIQGFPTYWTGQQIRIGFTQELVLNSVDPTDLVANKKEIWRVVDQMSAQLINVKTETMDKRLSPLSIYDWHALKSEKQPGGFYLDVPVTYWVFDDKFIQNKHIVEEISVCKMKLEATGKQGKWRCDNSQTRINHNADQKVRSKYDKHREAIFDEINQQFKPYEESLACLYNLKESPIPVEPNEREVISEAYQIILGSPASEDKIQTLLDKDMTLLDKFKSIKNSKDAKDFETLSAATAMLQLAYGEKLHMKYDDAYIQGWANKFYRDFGGSRMNLYHSIVGDLSNIEGIKREDIVTGFYKTLELGYNLSDENVAKWSGKLGKEYNYWQLMNVFVKTNARSHEVPDILKEKVDDIYRQELGRNVLVYDTDKHQQQFNKLWTMSEIERDIKIRALEAKLGITCTE